MKLTRETMTISAVFAGTASCCICGMFTVIIIRDLSTAVIVTVAALLGVLVGMYLSNAANERSPTLRGKLCFALAAIAVLANFHLACFAGFLAWVSRHYGA